MYMDLIVIVVRWVRRGKVNLAVLHREWEASFVQRMTA